MIILVSVVHTYDDFANLTTRANWVASMTECFAKMGAIGKWSRQVEIGAITQHFDMQQIGNDLLPADQGRNEETKAQTVAHRIEKTKEGYKATLGGYLDTLFGIFKIGNFLGNNNRIGAVRAYLLEFYQFVPYHNLCHGITVGLYSASIYAAKVNVKITEAFNAFYGGNQENDYANVFVNNVPNNAENRLMVKEALRVMQRLFMAGLFHDIGHSGFSNSSLGPTKAARNTNFLTILARPPVEDDFADQRWHCVANLADITAANAPRLRAFISNLLSQNDITALDDADGLENAQQKLADFHAVYGPRIAAIMRTIAQYGRVDQYKQVKAFCPSAEMIHALGAFNALHGKVSQADLESIIQAILNTNVLPHMRFGPASPAYPLNIPITERIVHVADVMGLVADNDNFRYEMLKQVIFEFFIERKVNPGSLAFMFPTQERLAEAQNELEVKAAYLGAFMHSQVNFAKSIVRDVRSADLEQNPYFIDGEANFGRRLNLFSEVVSYFENNPNYAAVMFEAQDWADFYNDNNWPRSYFRLV